VGGFPGGRWAEWNDRYRDDVRRFWRGDDVTVGPLATRLTGSSDLYLRDGRKPFHSINFITSHDGFTLRDLVSYNQKHNEMNGENNRDGSDFNLSWNHGVEGDTDDPVILELRKRQMKNFLATLLLSLGTPMVLGGDEFGRTQKGNNNAYCQNNEISWYDWNLLREWGDVYRFLTLLIHFRLSHHAFLRPEFYTGTDGNYNAMPDITWFDERGRIPDWGHQKKLLALRIDGSEAPLEQDRDESDYYIMFNASELTRSFVVAPPRAGMYWHRLIDTSLPPPEDFHHPPGSEPRAHPQSRYTVHSRSLVVLISR